MRPAVGAPSWVDGVQVDERRLQEYLHQKQHSLLLRGAAHAMKHTLEALPTTNNDDGLLHFGDSLMLRSGETEGLLQVDIADPIQVPDARAGTDGASLSTGRMIASCPRNVLTISRASDNDGFGDTFVHYGQVFRMAASNALSETAMYLYASQNSTEGLRQDETLMCLYPRAAAGTKWRILHRDSNRRSLAKNEVVRLQDPIVLQSEASGHLLCSDSTIRMNHYGNEWRVFGTAMEGDSTASTTATWSFVDSTWADSIVQAARANQKLAAKGTRDIAGLDAGPDPGDLLRDPVAAADHELAVLERDVADYSVLLRVYPQLRHSGMHQVRRLRRMCMSADVEQSGGLPARTFEGMLSWVGVRLLEGEMQKLINLFEVDSDRNTLDYRGFFKYMESNMSEVRITVVQDAYAKLQDKANGGFVEVCDLQRNWRPRCHPEVQAGAITSVEAMEEFLNQWDVASSDGVISYGEFLDYYRDVSMAVEQGEIFVDIVRKAWDL